MQKAKETPSSRKIEALQPQNRSFLRPLSRFLIDCGVVFLIFAFGWFLIGWLTQGYFLETAQSDWYVQAYRIEHLQSFGPISWDSSLGGGVSMWRAYPFLVHAAALAIKMTFGLSTTHAMIWLTVSTFVLTRVFLYFLLRSFQVRRLPAIVTTLLSFTIIQQWTVMQDFVFFNALVFVPLFVFLWKKSIDKQLWFLILSAVTGALFSVSTTLASILAFFWFFLVLAMSTKRISVQTKLGGIGLFMVSGLPQFLAQYALGTTFPAPIYASPQLLELSLSQEYLGLGLPLLMLSGITWIILLAQSKNFPQWAKMLLLFCTVILGFLLLSPTGLPQFILQLLRVPQILSTIALIACFSIAQALNRIATLSSSRSIGAVCMILIAVLLTQSVAAASEWGIEPVKNMSHGATQYFQDHTTNGRVFLSDVSRAVYFLPRNLRYATLDNRENQILTTQPVSQRMQQLLRNDMKYTGVSEDQVKAVTAYSHVLGIEYLILPQYSPLISRLTASESGQIPFQLQTTFTDRNITYDVLRNQKFGSLAVGSLAAMPEMDAEKHALPKPSILSNSWRQWDDAVYETVTAIQPRPGVQPVEVKFSQPNQIVLTWAGDFKPQTIYVQQSYDQGWLAGESGVEIKPTNLQFLEITLPETFTQNSLTLTHTWPQWHWPTQTLPLVSVFCSVLIVSAATLRHKRKKSDVIPS